MLIACLASIAVLCGLVAAPWRADPGLLKVTHLGWLIAAAGLQLGKINTILVFNAGDAHGGLQHSAVITERLRALLLNKATATELVTLLRMPPVRAAIDSDAKGITAQQGRLRTQVGALQTELDRDGTSDALRSLMADPDVGAWLTGLQLPSTTKASIGDLQRDLSTLRVSDEKALAVNRAEQLGAFFTSIFVVRPAQR